VGGELVGQPRADLATSGAAAGSPLIEGIRSHSTSLATYASAWSATCRRTAGSASVMGRLYGPGGVA